MPTIGYRLLAAVLALTLLAAAGEPPSAVLRRGINITNWFRFPPSRDPAALRAYLSDAALEELKRIGFTFVRLPVQPDLLAAPDALADAVARVQRHGLAVVVALFAEANPADRAKLLATWRSLAPALRRLDPAATFPEVLNEPVFAGDPAAWARLQHEAVMAIRASLPANTIVLTGADWGSVRGLLALPPESDPNVIYSFHLYDPAELTALGAYRPGLDAGSMARLPFPATDQAACLATADTARDPPTAYLMRFYCAQHWDVAKITARIAEAGVGPAPSRYRDSGGIRRRAATECARAPGLAHRGSRGLRAAGDRLGALGIRQLDGFRAAPARGTAPARSGGVRALG